MLALVVMAVQVVVVEVGLEQTKQQVLVTLVVIHL
jgi:hypothetical protein